MVLAPGLPFGGPLEIVLILVVIIIIFGVGRLPEVGGAVGRSIREFRHATKDDDGAAMTMDRTSMPGDAEATVFCGECGTANAASVKFCTKCGHAMGAAVT